MKSLKWFVCTAFCLLLMACKSESAKNAESAAPGSNGPRFVFAQGPKSLEYKAEGSWCDAHYPEAPPITGDPVNANLRKVGFGTGIYKVTINYGHIASSFILRNKSFQQVELYTSNHFPYCLSDHKNFKLLNDGLSFAYDNNHYIKYTVELQKNREGYFLAFLYDPGGNFGFSVRKCEDCKE